MIDIFQPEGLDEYRCLCTVLFGYNRESIDLLQMDPNGVLPSTLLEHPRSWIIVKNKGRRVWSVSANQLRSLPLAAMQMSKPLYTHAAVQILVQHG